MNNSLPQRIAHARAIVTRSLLAELECAGHWTGSLSTSALSTATAVIALSAVDGQQHARLIRSGLDWLAQHANEDGGWGDTTCSRSNLSTTALAWAAFGAARADAPHAQAVAKARDWITAQAGSIEALVPALEAAYGSDRTFSVPITMTLALSSRLGPDGWQRVHPLPFELGVLPPRWFGALRLPVVSYALPALIAIGQVIHHFAPTRNPLRRALRHLARRRSLHLLEGLQPTSGGFLEAIPLTSFVVMSLAAMGLADHPVARRGTQFLIQSARPDGSWAIDTNLATWATTLSIKALARQTGALDAAARARLRSWLLAQQYRTRHPYTNAAPGGWAWTDLPGGVPDADDTAGALLALHCLEGAEPQPDTVASARAGVGWLLDLQNRDGGIPTFCRGWGTLPFDRSTPELTAHAIRAWTAWRPQLEALRRRRADRAIGRAYGFLARSQQPDGSWLPLWFGNEHAPGHANPVYGTAQVLLSLIPASGNHPVAPAPLATAGRGFLLGAQNADGGWGGAHEAPSSVEETALAVDALLAHNESGPTVERGLVWLADAIEQGRHLQAAPIGLYFARLWYSERLYPLIFAAGALGVAEARRREAPSRTA